jgi:hypothetical protein
MNFKIIKNGFKMTTVALTIISLIGCSSSPKKDIPVYKQEMDEPLQIGMNYKKFEDDSELRIYVKKNNNISSVMKTSKLYLDEEMCWKDLSTEANILIEKLGPFKGQKKYEILNNKDYMIVTKTCEGAYNRENIKGFRYTIEVEPLSATAQENMDDVIDLFKGIALFIFGVVVVAPIAIVGIVVIGIPLIIYSMITGKQYW